MTKVIILPMVSKFIKDHALSSDKEIYGWLLGFEDAAKAVYITAVIVGSIFFIIMGIILGLMGGGQTLTLVRIVIYLGVPVISIMFMILISGLSPE